MMIYVENLYYELIKKVRKHLTSSFASGGRLGLLARGTVAKTLDFSGSNAWNALLSDDVGVALVASITSGSLVTGSNSLAANLVDSLELTSTCRSGTVTADTSVARFTSFNNTVTALRNGSSGSSWGWDHGHGS